MVSGKCKQDAEWQIYCATCGVGAGRETEHLLPYLSHSCMCTDSLEGHKKLCTLLPPGRGAEWDRKDLALYILLYL